MFALNGKSDNNLRAHPKGMYPILFSEYISRFAFWGIQSLLVLYLVSQKHFSNDFAYSVFGVYASMCWAVSILSGYVADRYLGFRRVLLFGFTFALIGNFFILIPGFLFLGLAFLVFGVGLIIPNNANMLGALYKEEDSRRDKGFGTFYVANNLGALSGPIVLGFCYYYLGWRWAFVLSGLSFLIWIGIYLKNRSTLIQKGNFDGGRAKSEFLPFVKVEYLIFIIFVAFGLLIQFLLQDPKALGYVIVMVSLCGVLYLLITLINYSFKERINVLLILFMMLFMMLFFACEFQTLNSFIIFMKDYINLSLFGVAIPVTTFVSAESLFVVILTFLITNPLWKFLGSRQPNYFVKLGIGALLAGSSFLIFAWTAHLAGLANSKVSLWWMVLGVAILALGELFTMPPLLAAITKLSPPPIKGTMMGIMYFGISISGYLSGEIAKLTSLLAREEKPVLGYQSTYLNLAFLMLGMGGLMFLGIVLKKCLKSNS